MYEWQTVGEDRYQLVLSCKKIESPERMRQMRILGLDFGSRTVGVAVSDGLLLTAQGVETIERKDENKLRKTAARIEELVKEYEITTIVMGLPKNMNNTEGERVEKTKAFGEMLERRTGLPVVYWDERLTTVAAEQVLMESGVRRENRKAVIDKIAACFILQGYLDHIRFRQSEAVQTDKE
jgi:putative Holliday junction resolvase